MAANPPSGTVTFLFTDIQGSTLLWQQYPSAMPKALALHHELLRRAAEDNNGYVFQIVGDAFCVAFSDPLDGIHCALSAQRALQAADWGETGTIRVRMALHTGTVELRAGDYTAGEYASGLALSRTARLLNAGYGEQVLVSELACLLVAPLLAAGLALHDLGEHRLKDLQRPERIYQLIAPGLPQDFPPLKTLNARPNNLPTQLTSLVGREQQVQRITNILLQPEVRLLTVTGPGGTGKTRLGLQVAAEVVEYFQDGVFFVPLASIHDPALVAYGIAHTLNLREQGQQPMEETIQCHLASRQILLLLDNFEQVIQSAPRVSTLLATCPYIKILVTSRTSLRLRGEHEMPIQPLRLPEGKRLPSIQALAQIPAIALFVDRARSVNPDFQLTPANAGVVADICTRLDGLPLAIELAVAYIKLLPPPAMLARLKEAHGPQRLLTRGAADLPERQRTLRSTLDWSYQLLSEHEQTVFRSLSVFANGFTLDAAAAVCPDIDPIDLLNNLEGLIDKSLLRTVDGPGDQPRYLMLELIREYAVECAKEAGELNGLQRLHARFFLELAERAEPELESPEQSVWLNLLEADHANFYAAQRWMLQYSDGESGLRISSALCLFHFMRGYLREGHAWLNDFLALPAMYNLPLRARALDRAGILARYMGTFEQAEVSISESLTIRRQLKDRQGIADSLANLGFVVLNQGNHALAWQYYREALAAHRELGNRQGIADSLSHLGRLSMESGDLDEAEQMHSASLGIWRSLEDQQGIAYALYHLGDLFLVRQQQERARDLFRESLAISADIGFQWGIFHAVEGIACLAAFGGQPYDALRLAGGAAALRQTAGMPLGAAAQARLDGLLNQAFLTLDQDQHSSFYEEGRMLSVEELIEVAQRVVGSQRY